VRALIWYAGHGHTIDGEGYLVPIDAPAATAPVAFRRGALSMRRFGEYMREIKAHHVLSIFDSCFAGTVFDTARSPLPPFISRATTLPVRQFITSGDAAQEVSDDGTFRKLFIAALQGNDPTADANNDGFVTGTELGLFLEQRVTNLTDNRQTPRYGKLKALGFDRGDIVFDIGRPPASTSVATTKVSPDQPSPRTTLPASPAEVCTGSNQPLQCLWRKK
jgi:uncharacterized caspase-like protein